MGYELKEINPTKYIFSYYLNSYDCYELRSGKCSLYLSESEAESIHEKDGITGESDVLYCRNLAKKLFQMNYFENINFQKEAYSIRMHQRHCGHYEFTDGQHRTCIAKHLNLQTIYAKIEPMHSEDILVCSACRCKQKIQIENSKKKNKILRILKLNQKTKIPNDILDEEYMNFKTDIHLKELYIKGKTRC
ncbi:hypothetical protein [Bacillus mycoides]|uniref:hypothetical protein n=1 Tax=Bacillus mycoides TaxID=1405 RepID=UPI003D0328A9